MAGVFRFVERVTSGATGGGSLTLAFWGRELEPVPFCPLPLPVAVVSGSLDGSRLLGAVP